jgi:hypothetical protein
LRLSLRTSTRPAIESDRSCSETAPKVTSGIARAISPALRSCSQTSRRISWRRGEASVASRAGPGLESSITTTI